MISRGPWLEKCKGLEKLLSQVLESGNIILWGMPHTSLCDKPCWLCTLAPTLHLVNKLLYLIDTWRFVPISDEDTYEFGICILDQLLSPLPQGRHKAAFCTLCPGKLQEPLRCGQRVDSSITVVRAMNNFWFFSSVFSPYRWDKRQACFLSLPKPCNTRAGLAVYFAFSS